MVKEYNKELLKSTGVLEFETKLHTLNEKKSYATIMPPFPALKEMDIKDKTVEMIITIKKKKK